MISKVLDAQNTKLNEELSRMSEDKQFIIKELEAVSSSIKL
jgi:hypothetical protein